MADAEVLIDNYKDNSKGTELRPYEAKIFKIK